jgi:SHS2 domain-containing protein
MYETFEHTADLGLRVRANSLERVFVEAAQGLFSIIVANPESIRALQQVSFTLAKTDPPAPELLLFDWLSELLFTYETRQLVLCDFDVTLDDRGLTATAGSEPIDTTRHVLDHEVKAITYHGLKLSQEDGQWLAELIVDI